MPAIELTSDFNVPREKVLKRVTKAINSGKTIDIEIPIAGVMYSTDSEELASEFLYAAYIGEAIAGECSSFTCTVSDDSVDYSVMPTDAEGFTSALWDAIVGFMSEDLLSEEGYDELSAADSRESGENLLDNPKLVRYTQDVVEMAREIMALHDEDDEDEDDDDNEDEDDAEYGADRDSK